MPVQRSPSRSCSTRWTIEIQLRNLAASAAHRDVLERMRSALREWALQMHDIGFVPEGELARRTVGSTTPWDMGRNGSAYPLSRVLDAADLVGRSGAVPTQIELLRDDDPVIRYWAAVGLRAAGDAGATALRALRQALNDPNPEVRIQAADALARLDAAAHAVETLAEALESNEPYIVLLAARTLQLRGQKARPARPAMERVLAVAQDDSAYEGLGMYVRFALEPALVTMSGTVLFPFEEATITSGPAHRARPHGTDGVRSRRAAAVRMTVGMPDAGQIKCTRHDQHPRRAICTPWRVGSTAGPAGTRTDIAVGTAGSDNRQSAL